MGNEKIKQAGPQDSEAPTMVFNIGGCEFTVGIHFSQDSKENMTDKINRMIRRDIQDVKYNATCSDLIVRTTS